MPKQKVEIELEVPEGYKSTGEFRRATAGEICLDCFGDITTWESNVPSHYRYLILTPIPRIPKVGEIWKNPITGDVCLAILWKWVLLTSEYAGTLYDRTNGHCLTFLASTVEEWAKGKYGVREELGADEICTQCGQYTHTKSCR